LQNLLPKLNKPQYDSKTLLSFEINELSADFFMNNLFSQSDQSVLEYLKTRYVNLEQIEQFKIGYATDHLSSLSDYLIDRGYQLTTLLELGLSRISEKDKLYDFFVNRIMFPIFNEVGRIIGFSGRSLEDNHNQKYLNSPETFLFKKQYCLYNLHFAKQNISNNKQLFLVEGYFDVISLSRLKIYNSVALMGTSLNLFQALQLQKIVSEIILFLDNDEAGKNAIINLAKICLQKKLSIRVIDYDLSSKKDPDQLSLTYNSHEKMVE
jgi:DNA primase